MRYLFTLFLFLSSPALAAATLLDNLSSAEKSYYEKVFNYTMDVTKPGEKYDWASYGGKGTIAVSAPFVSKSGSTCRSFSENFTVNNQSGGNEGVGCKRVGSEGWCKLKRENALTCAMESPAGIFGNVAVGSVSAPTISVPSIGAPSVNTGGGVVETGNTNTASMPASGGNQKKGDPTATSAADSVTSTAGKAAGSATGGAINWFVRIFGR